MRLLNYLLASAGGRQVQLQWELVVWALPLLPPLPLPLLEVCPRPLGFKNAVSYTVKRVGLPALC